MDIEEKKEFVLRFVSTGVETFSAYVMARCTDEEITTLEADESFQAEVRYLLEQDKIRLIRKYKEVAEKAADTMMDYKAIRTLIQDFIPDALGAADNSEKGSGVHIYVPDNGRRK